MTVVPARKSLLYIGSFLVAIWSIYILAKPVAGYNYDIYAYFAGLSNHGVDIFHLGDRPGPFAANYLDFTPADLVIYKAVFAVQERLPHAWFLYQLLWGWLALALTWVVASRQNLEPSRLWALALVVIISPAWLFLSAISGEDKLINAAVPLLLTVLVPERLIAAVVVGALYAGVSGFGLLYMPLLAVACWHRWPRQWLRLGLTGLIAALLIALTWVPYWPDSLTMLANRTHRESLPPFWYSIWMLAPGLFSPLLSKGLTLIVVALASLAFLLRRTGFLAAIIAIAFAYFLTTNFMNHYRIVSMLFLPLLAMRKGTGWWVYAGLAFVQLNVVLGFRLLHIPFPGPQALPWRLELEHVTLANMCLVAFLVMFFVELASRAGKGSGRTGAALAYPDKK